MRARVQSITLIQSTLIIATTAARLASWRAITDGEVSPWRRRR
jgi:hypothetical protein